MSKRFTRILSLCFVLCFLLTTVSIASASPLGDGPTVTPLTGSGNFTVKVVSLEDLPGTVKPEDGGVLPSTAPTGAKQFSGDGVQVTGLVGSASVCFPMKSSRYGWVGTVYSWDGTTWSKLATTMTENEEGLNPQACAVIYGDGIFALALGYKPPANPANDEISACTNIQLSLGGHYDVGYIYFANGTIYGDLDPSKFPEGKTFKYEVISLDDPLVTFSGDVTGTMTVGGIEGEEGNYFVFLTLPEDTRVYHTGESMDPPFTFRLYLSECYVDFTIDGYA